MKKQEVVTVKISGDSHLVEEVTRELANAFQVLTSSEPRLNDRDTGSHIFLTIMQKED